jgi:hypothetical protein
VRQTRTGLTMVPPARLQIEWPMLCVLDAP